METRARAKESNQLNHERKKNLAAAGFFGMYAMPVPWLPFQFFCVFVISKMDKAIARGFSQPTNNDDISMDFLWGDDFRRFKPSRMPNSSSFPSNSIYLFLAHISPNTYFRPSIHFSLHPLPSIKIRHIACHFPIPFHCGHAFALAHLCHPPPFNPLLDLVVSCSQFPH